MYIIAFIPLIFTLFIFKSRLIQFLLLIYIYPILITLNIYFTNNTSRIIKNTGNIFYEKYFEEALYLQLIGYLIILLVLFKNRKKIFFVKRIYLKNNIRLLLSFLLIIAYLLAYPSIFLLSDNRFGVGGSLIIVFNTLLLLSKEDKIKTADIIFLLVNFFAFLSGERADTISIMLIYFILKSKDNIIYERKINTLVIIGAFSTVILLAMIAGINRMGGTPSFDYMLNQVSNQGTAIDVTHVYYSAIWYYHNIGTSISPIINFLFSFIPFNSYGGATSIYNLTIILREHINNVGGGLFYSLGIIVGGPIGMMVLIYIYSKVINFGFSHYNLLKTLFIALCIQQFRLQWYGLNYMGNIITLIILLSAFYLLLKNIDYENI